MITCSKTCGVDRLYIEESQREMQWPILSLYTSPKQKYLPLHRESRSLSLSLVIVVVVVVVIAIVIVVVAVVVVIAKVIFSTR